MPGHHWTHRMRQEGLIGNSETFFRDVTKKISVFFAFHHFAFLIHSIVETLKSLMFVKLKRMGSIVPVMAILCPRSDGFSPPSH